MTGFNRPINQQHCRLVFLICVQLYCLENVGHLFLGIKRSKFSYSPSIKGCSKYLGPKIKDSTTNGFAKVTIPLSKIIVKKIIIDKNIYVNLR